MSKGNIAEPQDVHETIGGGDYTLRFSTLAWECLVEAWGLHSMQEAQAHVAKIGDATKVQDFVDLLWASLRRHHPEVTRAEAMNLADDAGIERLSEILPRLIRGSLPAPTPGAGKKKTARPNRR